MEIFERLESNVRAYCRVAPAVFDTARNACQFDEAGKQYIDFFAGAGVLNFGHNNPKMKQALIDYISKDGVTHSLDMYTTAKREFMQAFDEIILRPRQLEYKMQFTGPTGTNCVEAALKLARKITGRRMVVAFTDGFHGMTLGALACTGNQLFRNAAGVPLQDVMRVPYDGYLGSGIDTLEILKRQFDDPSSGITPPAAFLVETIQAEGGVNIASQEWLLALQAMARKHGSLLIVDDIQVGCGRTGTYFSFESIGLEPDLVCLAKGIGGFGTPLALLLIKPEYDQWKPGEHTGTFRGQDLSFVAGTQALRFFENDELLKSVRKKGEIIRQKLEQIVNQHDDNFCNESACRCPGNNRMRYRGKGMIYGLCIGDGKKAAAICKSAFENGLLIAGCGPEGRILKLIPPLTIENDILEQGLELFEKSVNAGLIA